MQLGVAQIDEEGLLGGRVALDVLNGLGDEVLLVHDRPHLQVERHHRLGRLALLPLQDHRRREAALGELWPGRISRLIPAVRNSPPLVETLIVGKPSRRVAEVPLAVERGGVAGVGEQLGGGVLPGSEPRLPLSGKRNLVGPRANRMPPGEDRCARRRALNFHVVVGEANALVGQPIDPWRRDRSTVHAEASPADVVDQEEHDVGLALVRCRGRFGPGDTAEGQNDHQ